MQLLGRNFNVPLLLDIAERFGVARQSILDAANITNEEAFRPNGYLPVAKISDALAFASLKSGRGDLGLLTGEAVSDQSFAFFAMFLKDATTTEEALAIADSSLPLMNAALSFKTLDSLTLKTFCLELLAPTKLGAQHYMEACMVVSLRFLRMIMGTEWNPARVEMRHARLSPIEAYRRIFGCAVAFNSPTYAIAIKRSDYEGRYVLTHTRIEGLTSELLVSPIEKAHLDISAAIKRAAPQLFQAGHSTLTTFANALNMSERTMQRELAALGKTFKQIITEVRVEIARKKLAQGRLTGKQLASTLGFSEPSSASRFLGKHNTK